MTAPEDQNGLREALARALARRDGWENPDALWTDNLSVLSRGGAGSPVWMEYVEQADALIADPLASLIAERDAAEDRAETIQATLDAEMEIQAEVRASLRAAEAEITRLKEGMEAALAKAFDAGFDISAEGWNAEHGVDRPEDDEGYRIACERAVARLLATLSPKEQP